MLVYIILMIDNKSWLHCFQIPPPKNSSTATVGKVWMLCMYKAPLKSCRKLYPPPPLIFKSAFTGEHHHLRCLMNYINSAAWGQTERLLNTYTFLDFKQSVKNLLKMYGFSYTALFCGILNLQVMLPATIQSLSSLINIYIRKTWADE